MKKVGYTVKNDSTEEIEQLKKIMGCTQIIEADSDQDNYTQFSKFLEGNLENELAVINFESIGLQLSQLVPLLEYIMQEKIKVIFLEKPAVSDQEYLKILYDLALGEKQIVSRRTLNGLRQARAKGTVSGRPSINNEIIEKIKYLHDYQRKNIREIATECGVSLGTVHKYIKMNEG